MAADVRGPYFFAFDADPALANPNSISCKTRGQRAAAGQQDSRRACGLSRCEAAHYTSALFAAWGAAHALVSQGGCTHAPGATECAHEAQDDIRSAVHSMTWYALQALVRRQATFFEPSL